MQGSMSTYGHVWYYAPVVMKVSVNIEEQWIELFIEGVSQGRITKVPFKFKPHYFGLSSLYPGERFTILNE